MSEWVDGWNDECDAGRPMGRPGASEDIRHNRRRHCVLRLLLTVRA